MSPMDQPPSGGPREGAAPQMSPPFPSGLSPRTARRQATALLLLFYAIVYGSAAIAIRPSRHILLLLLSTLGLGAFMLLITAVFVRRDPSWRESLGLGRQTVPWVVGWSLLGFVGTYTVNIALTIAYVSVRGNLEAVAAHRLSWLGVLAGLPSGLILPLAAFVGLWEETVFRGFLLGRLRAAMPVPDTPAARLRRDMVAVAVSAVLFGAGHGYQGLLGLLQTTVAGLVLGTLVIWRGSLWPAIGAHLTIDAFSLGMLQALKATIGSATGP
jgi:membrane protease YdiL (CAAX protease family)